MSDITFDNHRSDGSCQTFIIPLTYPNISLDAENITRIGYGGDIWELRVDLLSNSQRPISKTNLPPLEYVEQQVKLLQSLSPMPMLFTIRRESQGGKFPDDAKDEALDLMLMAMEAGCQYIDVEIEWPRSLPHALLAKKEATKLVASYHDWTGNIRWTSPVLQEKYAVADAFGDIIKLSILSRDVYDCHELALFLRTHLAQSQKPLLAVGMGQHGQLSRVLSPISLVTHRLLPAPSAPGQLTLAEVHQARHLIGQLPKREFSVVGDPVSGASVCRMHEAAFGELGFPHSVSFLAGNQQAEQALHQLLRKPAFGGAALVAASSGVNALGLVDSVSDAVKQIGVVDAIIVKEVNGERQLVGDNVTWEVIHSCAVRAGLMGALLYKGATAVIGGGDRKFAAIMCYAVKQLGFTTVRCIGHGDGDRSGDLAAAFPDIKIQEADSLDSLLKDLTNNQPLIVCSDIASEGTKVNAVINALSARDNGGAIIDLYADEGALAGIVSNRPMWKSFGSSSTLKELACRHFTAWTGRKAPESIIMDVI